MRPALETAGWIALLAALGGAVVAEGATRADLERRLPIEPQEVYRALARSQATLQIVDVREDLVEDYEDAHVPGAIPWPACDPDQAPEAARGRVLPSVPTVIVGLGGDDDLTARCAGRFTSARRLAGGMEGWSDANLPEDSGEYSAPSSKAGGGCL